MNFIKTIFIKFNHLYVFGIDNNNKNEKGPLPYLCAELLLLYNI